MKRPCGCGERGRHKPDCKLVGISKPKIERKPRTCGCGVRGRHKPTCSLSDRVTPVKDKYIGKGDVESLYNYGYGKPPQLEWYPDRSKQRTVENRIVKLVRRYKPFYLTTNSLDTGEKELWYIDGGNWVHHENKLIGHIKNCLKFLHGSHPLW